MTRGRAMTSQQRAAMADALKHMRRAGVRRVELVQIAGKRARLSYEAVRIADDRRPQ